jgi:uncharacterized protein DUF3606
MSDDLSKRGGQDRKRIDVSQDWEVRDWAQRFGVSQEDVKSAVKAVGDKAADVERYLKGKKPADQAARSFQSV